MNRERGSTEAYAETRSRRIKGQLQRSSLRCSSPSGQGGRDIFISNVTTEQERLVRVKPRDGASPLGHEESGTVKVSRNSVGPDSG
jgi:hypothetical protein